MLSSDGKISVKQLQKLMFLEIFGTGVIALPRIAAGFAGNDGWLLVIGALPFVLLYLFFLNSLAEMFPNEGFAEYSRRIIGKPAGSALSILLAAKMIFTAGIELRILGEILLQTMLYNTPRGLTCLVTAAAAAYMAHKGFEARARIAETLFFFVLIPLLAIFSAAAANADYTNFLPILKTPYESIILGSFYISFAFRGLELTLLLYPFVKEPGEIKTGQLRAVIFTGIAILFITAVTLLKFGENDVQAQLWPVIQMTDTLTLAGKLFERQDALLLSLWLIAGFIYLSGQVFFSSYIFGRIRNGSYSLLCASAIYAVSFLPRNTEDSYRLLAASDLTLGIVFLLAVPVFLAATAKIRGLGGGKH